MAGSPLLRLRYDNAMKPPPTDAEFANLTEAMRTIMRVSKADIQDKDKPKTSTSPGSGVGSKSRS